MELTGMMKHPGENEIQLVVFGPGYGESILVHLGSRKWIMVDSCVDVNNFPISLNYLNQIGVNLKSEVVAVIATHWHDDHIRGLEQIILECESADIAISAALRKTEFFAYLQSAELEINSKLDRGGTEMLKCLKVLRERRRVPIPITQNKKIWSCDSDILSH